MKRWLKRTLCLLAAVVVTIGAFGAWRFQHPAMPAGSLMLPTTNASGDGLVVRYFGTTTLAFDDGHDAIMVDALLTRPGMGQVLFKPLASDISLVDSTLRRAQIGKVDLLLISHSHYDHVVDADAISDLTGAKIVGSPSTREVALGGGIPPSRIEVVSGGERLKAGDFTVTIIRSRHSFGDQVPGIITSPVRQPASAKAYKEGGTFAFLIEHKGFRIIVHASANFVPGMYRGVKADAIFLATGGLSSRPADFTKLYWQETVEATGAKLVIPIHWDDFFEPLDRPLQPLRRFLDNVPLTMDRIAPLAQKDGAEIRYMPVIAPVDIEGAARAAEANRQG